MSLKTNLIKSLNALPRPHKVAASVTGAVCALMLLFPSDPVVASRHSEAFLLEAGKRYELALPDFAVAPQLDAHHDLDVDWVNYKVRSGDTLAKIFKRAGLTPRDTHEVSRAGELAKMLVSIMPGESISILLGQDGKFSALRYPYSTTETLYIEAQTNDETSSRVLNSRVERKKVDIRHNFAQGQIESNFWNAGVAAGLTDNQIMQLADIFGWDIDFALDIRKGDAFNIVFEERYIAGEFVGYGDIVAAEFTNQDEHFDAIRYTDGKYYSSDGRSMRKSFLRAPVHFTRVSSNFNPKRFHPVLKRIKPHRGVDYVAPVGTPIMSAGDGRVIKAGYDKYNGHHVFVQHGEKYTTKYLHFKKRAVKKGDWVKQGQVIGYLGSSGMVTGAHLHYEFLVNGVHRNPRTVALPKADPIASSERAAFEQIASVRLEQLSNNKRIMLAMN